MQHPRGGRRKIGRKARLVKKGTSRGEIIRKVVKEVVVGGAVVKVEALAMRNRNMNRKIKKINNSLMNHKFINKSQKKP
jgi:hypothetical protein